MKNEHRKVMKLWKVTDHHHHESELQGSQDCSSMHLNSGSSGPLNLICTLQVSTVFHISTHRLTTKAIVQVVHPICTVLWPLLPFALKITWPSCIALCHRVPWETSIAIVLVTYHLVSIPIYENLSAMYRSSPRQIMYFLP